MKYIVCPRCEGEGKIVNPEVDGNGIPASELDDDPDFAEAYFGGWYDITCPACLGKRVITRKEYNLFNQEEHERREGRLLMLRESGIYPGHRDYF